ncbi:carboxypeptidase-like regulatory domain-containing protein [Flavobacterium sp. MFBS3-15]|uniref:carboxypeptidase-like regulatory domain-containing protein n=1 Tax=Flavobacterium sp. MFBS3-15 TaxID=2989816 RepID=UPI002235D22B|nr:carboxypeptidase-like regulatory domain-containing protein [Flavobacterium sp. MFBS3-15]MCW4467541.1 carboxypeptidase-like regulatory domain-containing protein [Flavobacterium sp. MFBS3-15]
MDGAVICLIMNKFLIILLLIGFSSSCKAISVIITDIQTNQPVQFASVILLKNGKTLEGNYCDIDGKIQIDTTKAFDSIEFSCVGYKPLILQKNELTNIIYLEKEIIQLDEVIISSNAEIKTIGYGDKKNNKKYRGINKGGIVAVYIENPYKKPTRIQSFIFITQTKKYHIGYRFHLYSAIEDKIWPGNEISSENITGILKPGVKGHIEIDLSGYDLILPSEGAYIGLEAIGEFDQNGNLVENSTVNLGFAVHQSDNKKYCERYSFSKNGWQNINDWLTKDYKNSFGTDIAKEQLVAPSFSIKIIVPNP